MIVPMPQVMPSAEGEDRDADVVRHERAGERATCAPASAVLLRALLLGHALRRVVEQMGELLRQDRLLRLLIERHGEAAEDAADERDDA